MKPGTRALGIAESTDESSGRCTLCGAVVRADRAVDGFAFATATVGGLDATDAVCALVDRLDREDVRYLLLSGVAPAWFNVLDLPRIAAAADRPVLSVSYEASPGLDSALREQFDGEALRSRLAVYERLPPRRRLRANDETLFVRSVGLDEEVADTEDAARDDVTAGDGAAPRGEAARIVRAFTPVGGRPEPIRVARLAARGARQWEAAERDTPDNDSGGADRHG
ncbi:endonuclease dU [Halobellus sp. GM3]|uniref:endonuclease dU n=1 Tax=Halobellus sp. GM3 TaxID=3458410 RepID=UPI00403DE4B8